MASGVKERQVLLDVVQTPVRQQTCHRFAMTKLTMMSAYKPNNVVTANDIIFMQITSTI